MNIHTTLLALTLYSCTAAHAASDFNNPAAELTTQRIQYMAQEFRHFIELMRTSGSDYLPQFDQHPWIYLRINAAQIGYDFERALDLYDARIIGSILQYGIHNLHDHAAVYLEELPTCYSAEEALQDPATEQFKDHAKVEISDMLGQLIELDAARSSRSVFLCLSILGLALEQELAQAMQNGNFTTRFDYYAQPQDERGGILAALAQERQLSLFSTQLHVDFVENNKELHKEVIRTLVTILQDAYFTEFLHRCMASSTEITPWARLRESIIFISTLKYPPFSPMRIRKFMQAIKNYRQKYQAQVVQPLQSYITANY